MKKLLLSLMAVAALSVSTMMNAQTVLFEDSFESYADFEYTSVGEWTLIDVDGKTTYGFQGITFPGMGAVKAFQVYNATTTTPPTTPSATSNWTARTGNKMMAAFASTSAPWNNDWLVSPRIQLLADGGKLSFWAKSCDATYGNEKFQVYVSTTGTAVTDFTAISPVVVTPADATWHEYTYNLSAYADQAVYIAIQCTSEDQFGFAVDDFKVVSTPLQTEVPGCATLLSPADGAVDITAPVVLSWAAPTTGGLAASYDVYFGTTPNPTTLLGSFDGTSHSIPGTQLQPLTTYYWRVVPKNNVGSAVGCNTEFSFTTKADPFLPYCGPLNFTSTVEPITLVEFAGINNVTPAATAGATAHEVFTNLSGSVTQGGSYQIRLKGNTAGNYTNRFAVFIDWNQNGILNDPGEVYEITTLLVNSTGVDAKEVTQMLNVPADALLGTTRMRVKKIFSTTDYLNPCKGASFGQAEDYSIVVGAMAVNDAAKAKVKVYPNPVVDFVTIESEAQLRSVTVFDLSGKAVRAEKISGSKNQIDMRNMQTGTYIISFETEKGVQSVKVVKK